MYRLTYSNDVCFLNGHLNDTMFAVLAMIQIVCVYELDMNKV